MEVVYLKSNIKRDYVLKYLLDKFNDTTQDVSFVMGSDGMPLYKPISKEGAEGNADEYSFINEETYQLTQEQYVAVSIPVITADYSNLANMDLSQRVTSSSWSAVVEFLVYADSYVHKKLTFTMEEFRDKFLGKLDFLEGREFDFDNTNVKPVTKYYNVVTTASDVMAGGIITINGDKYISYTLQIDLDVSDDLAYGNQFEFYIKSASEDEYTRVLPIQVSWGASNSLEGKQLLNNSNLSVADADKAKMIHSIVSSRGWAINYTFIFDPNIDIMIDLFKETFIKKDVMNTPFYIQIKFKKKVYDAITGIPTWEYDDRLEFDYTVITGEGGTEVVYGDIIMFSIGFTPSWVG